MLKVDPQDPQTCQCPKNSDRYRYDDGQRDIPALILTHKKEIRKYQGEGKQDCNLATGFLFLKGH
jgi:hypothetical protein